jgi:hypothetical protein
VPNDTTNLGARGFDDGRTSSERFRKGLKLSAEQKKGIHPVEPMKPLVPSDRFKVA